MHLQITFTIGARELVSRGVRAVFGDGRAIFEVFVVFFRFFAFASWVVKTRHVKKDTEYEIRHKLQPCFLLLLLPPLLLLLPPP